MDDLQAELDETLRRLACGRVDAEMLLGALARMGAVGEPYMSRAARILRERAAELETVWHELGDWVRDWPSPPSDAQPFRSWLVEAESLGLARDTLITLSDVAADAQDVSDALAAVLVRFRVQVEERRDHARYAGLAEQRNRKLGRSVPPWNWIRAGEVRALISESDDGAREVSELWLDGLVHSADASLLRAEVTNSASFREAYANLLRERLASLELTQWTAAWSLDVARSEADADLDVVPALLQVPLPHLDAAITVWQHEAGAGWRGPTGALELLSANVDPHRYQIAQLGDFETAMIRQSPSQAQDVWHGLASLRRVADDQFANEANGNERLTRRAEELVDAFVASFEAGVLREALCEGHDAFESGADTTEDLDCLVRYALEARLELSLAIQSLGTLGRPVEKPSERLAATDEALRVCSSAVLLVDARDYRDLVEGVPLDRTAWWAARRVLDARVPEGVVEEALMVTTAAQPVPANVVSLPRSDTHLLLHEQPLALAAADVEIASSRPSSWLVGPPDVDPGLGHVPLLLFDERTGQGVVAELGIVLEEGHVAFDALVWQHAESLSKVARDAVRTAYLAAGELTGDGVPPFSFAEHRVQLRVPADVEVQVIEGTSVALAAALAFVSVWTKTPVARDVAATAGLAGATRVLPVGRVNEKAQALAGVKATRPLRLLVAPANVASASVAHVQGLSIATLEQAVVAAGLNIEALAKLTCPSTSKCEDQLTQHIKSVRTGELQARHPIGWRQLADEIARLTEILSKQPTDTDLAAARCWAALAYLHAGELGPVRQLLSRDGADHHDIEVRTLMDVVTLAHDIDTRGEMAVGIDRLSRDVNELERTAPGSFVLGYALGTLGRAHMHQGELDQALPLLQKALEHHQARQEREAARSRVYLAMALRLSGLPSKGLAELQVASRELETVTRAYSQEYEQACRMYLEYERARTLLALEDYPGAEKAATVAAHWSHWTNWPLLGILRTRAWARRMLGRDSEADQDVAQMQGIDIESWIKDPLVIEAQGYPFDGGEIY